MNKALLNLVKGVHSIEDFSEHVVSSAVTDTIVILSERYGLNATALLDELVDPLVKKHAHVTVKSQGCKAITYRGKKCTHDAVANGYCKFHRKQVDENPKKRAHVTREEDGTVAKITRLLTSARQMSVEDR